jgi:hypothetical protein
LRARQPRSPGRKRRRSHERLDRTHPAEPSQRNNAIDLTGANQMHPAAYQMLQRRAYGVSVVIGPNLILLVQKSDSSGGAQRLRN